MDGNINIELANTGQPSEIILSSTQEAFLDDLGVDPAATHEVTVTSANADLPLHRNPGRILGITVEAPDGKRYSIDIGPEGAVDVKAGDMIRVGFAVQQ